MASATSITMQLASSNGGTVGMNWTSASIIKQKNTLKSLSLEILDGRIDGSEAKKRSRCMINFKFPVDVSDYPD